MATSPVSPTIDSGNVPDSDVDCSSMERNGLGCKTGKGEGSNLGNVPDSDVMYIAKRVSGIMVPIDSGRVPDSGVLDRSMVESPVKSAILAVKKKAGNPSTSVKSIPDTAPYLGPPEKHLANDWTFNQKPSSLVDCC